DFPTIVVSAFLPGGSPETMASSVATPLERQFSTIAGLASMVSTSGQGVSTTTMQFDLDPPIDGAALDVPSATTIAPPKPPRPPQKMPTPPIFHKAHQGDSPVIPLSLNPAPLPLYQVDEFAETLLAEQMGALPGGAQGQVCGPRKAAVAAKADPAALAAKGLT